MNVRAATKEDIRKVVEVHIAAFPGFFLTMLGKHFLHELYTAFLSRETGILRVAYDSNGVVLGFAAGTNKPNYFYSKLRKDKWFKFLIRALPSLIKNPALVVCKLYHALFYKGDTPTDLENSALLSSIAVSPEHGGKSIGKLLLRDYEEQIRNSGVPSLYLTTDKLGNEAVVGFYKRCNYEIESEFTQASGRNMLRLIKTFKYENFNDKQ